MRTYRITSQQNPSSIVTSSDEIRISIIFIEINFHIYYKYIMQWMRESGSKLNILFLDLHINAKFWVKT